MATSASASIFMVSNLRNTSKSGDAWRLREYNEAEIPFTPEGNRPLIDRSVEKVLGTSSYAGEFARKTVLLDRPRDCEVSVWRDGVKRNLARELKIIHHARHYHIVQFVHAYLNVEEGRNASLEFCYVMDRMDDNLRYYLIRGQVQEMWYGCLLEAVQHIHSHGVRHGNMKPENILIQDSRLVLTDFGALQSRSRSTRLSRIPPVSKEYRAPEVAANRNCYLSADIFSLGGIFLEMIVAGLGVQKYGELSDILERNDREESSFTQSIPQALSWIQAIEVSGWQANILKTCKEMLNKDEEMRPSAQQIFDDWKDKPWACHCRKAPSGPTEYDQFVEACQSNSQEEIDSLLERVSYEIPPSFLHYAIQTGSKHVIDTLLCKCVPIDEQDSMGRTALHYAASSGRVDLVEYLLGNGASTTVVDENSQTALHHAAKCKLLKIFDILQDAGVPVGEKDRDGKTAMDILQAG